MSVSTKKVSHHTAITIINLTKNFGKLLAVNDVSLTIPEGEIFGLLGPNGAGKTTLIHCLMGIYKLKTGKINILGYDIPKMKIPARHKIGFMPQELAIYLDLTPLQNALFYGRIFGLKDNEIKQKLDELFHLLVLTDKKDKLCRTLSGGQKRRVSLGISLLTEPDLLILDEPTVGVDPILRQEFWDYFKELKSKGKTILISTHITDEAVRTDRVGLMMEGKMLAVGNPKALMNENSVKTLEELFIHFKKGGNN
ncbi:ABC transporter ATP-binding protein [Candidatus Hodarchaeum mangrovi]